jgi:hypothetical protein
MNLDGKGILLDKKDFDGDWDYVWATRGTKSSVVITKYKCFEDGKLLKPSDWIIYSSSKMLRFIHMFQINY